MPYLIIRTLGSTFEDKDDGADYPDVDAAYQTAVNSGIALASEEIADLSGAAIIEISVEDVGGTCVDKGAIAISVARFASS